MNLKEVSEAKRGETYDLSRLGFVLACKTSFLQDPIEFNAMNWELSFGDREL